MFAFPKYPQKVLEGSRLGLMLVGSWSALRLMVFGDSRSVGDLSFQRIPAAFATLLLATCVTPHVESEATYTSSTRI